MKVESNKKSIEEFIDFILPVTGRTIVEFSGIGVETKCKNKADSSFAYIRLPKEEFSSFDVDNERLGINHERLSDIIGMANSSDDVVIEKSDEDDESEFTISFSGMDFTQTTKDKSNINEPTKTNPDLEWGANFSIGSKRLKKIFDACDEVGEHITLKIDNNVFMAESEGDIESVSIENNPIEEYKNEDDETVVTGYVDYEELPNDCETTFSLEFIEPIVSNFPSSEDVKIDVKFGDELPVMFEFKTNNGVFVRYMIAPVVAKN